MPFPPGQSTPSNRRRALQGAALVLAGSLLCGVATAQAKKEVVIGYQDMVVPWRHAQETKEVERRTGYHVTYRKLGSGAEVVRALASGAIQIGEAGSSPIAAALSQGVPIEVFWVLDNINDAEALVARNGSGVNSLADLKGKKIGLPFVSTTHFHALVALQDAGVDPKTVDILNLRPPENLAAWGAWRHRRHLRLGPGARQGQAEWQGARHFRADRGEDRQGHVRRTGREPGVRTRARCLPHAVRAGAGRCR